MRFCLYTNLAQYAMAKASGTIEKLEKTGAKVYYTVGADHSFTSDGETLTYSDR